MPVIVCAVDESQRAAYAVRAARWLATELEAAIVLAHVFDPMAVQVPPSKSLALSSVRVDDLVGAARTHAQQSLASAAQLLDENVHTTVFVEGNHVAELLRLVRDHDARLLITATAAPGTLERVLIGSVTSELASKSPCPVVAVPADAALAEPGPVLAAYDGSDDSLRAARHGAALAARMNRELVLLHVTESGDTPVRADKGLARELYAAGGRALAGLADGRALDLRVSLAGEEGDTIETITRVGRDRRAALIVAGTRGRNAVTAALVGSVSAGVVRTAGRPVVLASPTATY